ncbi:hypothetical protein EYF80_058065 [Liparis tanakae]|uniref:Uncharacterized protein n=1 Tax=Liparis tanakae TaxID=230148 RepID=A0A4Z2ES82_9TELE|nr:hypothetical protein EYF80_058065 [Liparis tanakae]
MNLKNLMSIIVTRYEARVQDRGNSSTASGVHITPLLSRAT